MVDLSLTTELIERVYLCALGQQSWLDFMVAFQALLPGAGSNFLITTNTTMVGSLSLNTGFSNTEIDHYNQHYSMRNPWIPMVAETPPGIGLNTDRLLDPSVLRRTAYYQDFMRPLGLNGAVGVVVAQRGGRSFVFNTMTASDDFETKQGAADVLTALSPHLHKAFDYIQNGSSAESKLLLSAIGVGVIMVSGQRVVHSINDRAQEMLDFGCGISIAPTGRYRFVDASIQEAVDGISKTTAATPVAIFSSSNSRSPRFRYTLVRISSQPMTEYLGGPNVAIIIEQLTPKNIAQGLETLAVVHKLTKAECAVVRCIIDGASINDAAIIRGVSRETIRSQLKNIYTKMNISGKSDLLRIVL